MTNYDAILDDEMKAFVERTNSFYPPETASFSIDRQRAIYDRMCAAFRAERPAGIIVKDSSVSGTPPVPVRSYDPAGDARPAATILYYHGGGYVVGGLESHDDVCAELCARTGYRVISVDYRLSPEHQHPAAFDDAMAAFADVAAATDGPVLVAGDSAGGNLAAAVSHATRGHRLRPAGQILIYPGLGGDSTRGSYVEHAHAPMLTKADIDFYSGIRTGGIKVSGDPNLAPLQDTDFSNLPPTIAFPAAIDPLCDDAVDYCALISRAGGKALCLVQEGWLHGGLRARHTTQVGARAFDAICTAALALGEGRFPD